MIFEYDQVSRSAPEKTRPTLRSLRRIDAENLNLALVLNLIRTGEANTRQEIERHSGLGRAIVTDRLRTLTNLQLIDESELGVSTGGRAPRNVQFRDNAGVILLAVIGPSTIGVSLADLSGQLHIEHHESVNMSLGPATVLKRLFTLFDWVLEQHLKGRNVWGIGIAISAPVEASSGQPFISPILHFMPGWDEFPLIEHLAVRYGAPVWLQNSVQMMALGEQRAVGGAALQNLIYVDLGKEISAGLISDGRLHTGTQGAAGMIGHIAVGEDSTDICRCGNVGCLETIVGADAIVRNAVQAAQDGRSRLLAEVLATADEITSADVGSAAQLGDSYSAEVMANCGKSIGTALASLTNAFNPTLIVLGGVITETSDILLAAIRETVYRKSHPLVTSDLRIIRSKMGSTAALVGAAMVVVDELLSTAPLSFWVAYGSPLRHPEVERLLIKARQKIADQGPRPRPPEVTSPKHDTAAEVEF